MDLGALETDLEAGVVWIPETRWVVLKGAPFIGANSSLLAVNTETAERTYIEVDGQFVGFDDVLLFVSDTAS